MDIKVPILKIIKPKHHIIYFDPRNIDCPDKLSAAYIVTNRNCEIGRDREVYAEVNDFLSNSDLRLINKCEQRIGRFKGGCKVLSDATEAVKMISSGYVENKGIVLKNAEHLCNVGLIVHPRQEIIYPYSEGSFFEKKLCISSYTDMTDTPWFYSGISDTITFFIHNLGKDDITIYSEISPDTEQRVKGSQRITMRYDEVTTVVPDKFSKFIRLVINSDKRRIHCKIWFQSQSFTLPMAENMRSWS